MAVKTRILAWGHGFPGPLHGVRAGSADVEMEIFREVEPEIEALEKEARAREGEIEELAGSLAVWKKRRSETLFGHHAAGRHSHVVRGGVTRLARGGGDGVSCGRVRHLRA
jgi:hypothetical protein